ncbi:OmpA family protein [Angustibacter speluncae]
MRTRTARGATVLVAAAVVLGLGAPTSGATTTSPSSGGSSESSSGGSSEGGGTGGTATPDLVEPQTSADDVEVSTYGVISVRSGQDRDNPRVTMALHGVRRIDGATVVYFSAGQESDTEDFAALTLSDIRDPTRGSTVAFGSVRITDVEGGMVYRTVEHPTEDYHFGSTAGAFPTGEQKGTMGALYAVLPELPAETQQVNVELLDGQTIADVPVEDGALEPTVDAGRDEVIPLGTGWPEVDEGLVGQIDGEAWSYPLISTVEALDGAKTVTTEEKTVTIDLQADVLFAFDRADLSPQAQATLTQIAQQLQADGATGQVQILGHTDSQGSDAYNLDLSNRRAQSVAAVLQPALSGQSLTFAVEGRGEAEPVANNGTPEGQQANRRVSIVYTTAGD